MNKEERNRLEEQTLHHGDLVAALVRQVGLALGADVLEVSRLAHFANWLFCEGAHYGIVIAGMAHAEKEKPPNLDGFEEW